MFFISSKIFWFFFCPSHLLALFTVFTLLGFVWPDVGPRWRNGARRTAWAIIGILLLLFTLPVGDWAIFPLEAKAPPALRLPTKVDGIVILGAAIDENITAYHGIVALNGQAERILYSVPLIRRYPDATVVYAGGSPSGNTQTEADLAKVLFQMWNINTNKFIFERGSRNTYENIKFSKELANPQPNQNWLLITSAAHMPRAIAVAQKAGWEMVPYPVDYVSGGWTALSSGNLRYNLERLDKAAQEYVGFIGYRLSGYL